MIKLPVPPSVNGLYGQRAGRQRYKSKKYNEWLAKCPKLFHSEIDSPVVLTYKYYFPDKRIRDLGNYEKAATDFLVRSRVLRDDNFNIITKLILEFGGIDEKEPRVEIDIDVL